MFVDVVNKVLNDFNRWWIIQNFVVSVLRSVGKEDRGGVSLVALVAQRLVTREGGAVNAAFGRKRWVRGLMGNVCQFFDEKSKEDQFEAVWRVSGTWSSRRYG